MKKLYHLYNENFEITHAQFFIEGQQPENSLFIENCNFIKPMVNSENFEVYEGATPEEIAELNKPIVPQTISAMRLKLQLFDMGITDEDIFEDIDSIPESMFSVSDKEKAKIKYKTATTFERTNGELNFIATMEGLTQEQVDEIFINGNL
jgi:hypothetical protein